MRSTPWYPVISHEIHCCLGAICEGLLCTVPSGHMHHGVVQFSIVVNTQRLVVMKLIALCVQYYISDINTAAGELKTTSILLIIGEIG